MLMTRSSRVRRRDEVRYEVEDMEFSPDGGERKGWWVSDFEAAARIYGDAIRAANHARLPHIIRCSQVVYFGDGSTKMSLLHRADVGGDLF